MDPKSIAPPASSPANSSLLIMHQQLQRRILEEEQRLLSQEQHPGATTEQTISRPMLNSILLGSILLQDTSGAFLPQPRLPPPGLSQREQLMFHINDALAIMDEDDEDLFDESDIVPGYGPPPSGPSHGDRNHEEDPSTPL
mmetsp:Transcript_14011/g.30635  ORF Transcript_14011/g.30635 Transcript_14011/m.30635 type:complete len:141 (-) Transcript_14011:146-568(-)|eukprot:CAMPEP_0168771296 /NCGR_PEP_ID=MMETSP0725-20121227/3366_1 /TAXON_ID=265536 /ORGANISM="Amphiprora sp., Strain CCMP467" /LENGTH=140 /DNA_ID=CAMNT_0008820775 /DNA_START=138 /DNA_END=560 /DNA_ORIENTATION=-